MRRVEPEPCQGVRLGLATHKAATVRVQRRLILIYVILLVLVVAQSIWWVIYLSREGEHYGNFQLQRLKTEQLHAVYLMRSVPEIAAEPEKHLAETFPELRFVRHDQGIEVIIDPGAERAVHEEVRRRQRMFMWEGAFFLSLVLSGAFLVTLAYRRELAFKRSRELFLAGVTHEFKTPLASLMLYTETLGRADLDEAKRGGILQRMGEDLQRLGGMVEQVLAASRAQTPRLLEPEVLDLAEEVDRCLVELGLLADRKGIVIAADLPGGRRIMGDRQALQVALRNLISNAFHYSPERGRVSLQLEEAEGRHQLSVGDEGPGIPRSEQKRIFRSFYRVGETARRPQGAFGTGLGLYLVRQSTEALGGRVELDSEPGRGATFTLVLPAHRV